MASALLSSEPLKITPLGAGNEVGRSCIVVTYKGKTIMFDCGIHPAYSGLSALPFFDEIDPSSIDIVFISHFHLDHAASLPYFTEKTSFRGRIYMTHPTKAIYKWLLSDYIRVTNASSAQASSRDQLYVEDELLRSYEKVTAIDFHQQIDVDGIRFTAYNAGHVLGAAMFLVEIAGVRLLYTGDYSREEDRHLMVAEIPPLDRPIDVLICESTYGVANHMPRTERENRFTSLVHEIVGRGGRCLLPVFALGRAQELLLILDEYWQAHPELQSVPIYFASSLAKRCMTIYQTYINMMNEHIRSQFQLGNPFIFKHISTIKSIEQFEDSGPCVMLASPGMLQNGVSRELFEQWCPNRKNGVVVAGYCVEGTLAKQILGGPTEIVAMSGAKIPLRMTVEYISFSAHVDFSQNLGFIEAVKPAHLIFVHGESNEMGRLKIAINQRLEQKQRQGNGGSFSAIHCPRNCETIELQFRGEKVARVMGSQADGRVSGILLGKDFDYEIIEASQLTEFTNLACFTLRQSQTFSCSAPFSLLQHHIAQLFGGGSVQRASPTQLVVLGAVRLDALDDIGAYSLQWEGSILNDMIADAIAAISVHAEISRSSVKMTQSNHCGHEPSVCSQDVDITLRYLQEHFPDVSADPENSRYKIQFAEDSSIAYVDAQSMEITCSDPGKMQLLQRKLGKLQDMFQLL